MHSAGAFGTENESAPRRLPKCCSQLSPCARRQTRITSWLRKGDCGFCWLRLRTSPRRDETTLTLEPDDNTARVCCCAPTTTTATSTTLILLRTYYYYRYIHNTNTYCTTTTTTTYYYDSRRSLCSQMHSSLARAMPTGIALA